MRNCENLKDIHMTTEQRAIMKIAREGLRECLETECRNCRDRHIKNMDVTECIMMKIAKKLIEAGYAPVVHGKWIDGAEHFTNGFYEAECGVCGNYIRWNEGNDGEWNYCPNCGAKMDGGDRP